MVFHNVDKLVEVQIELVTVVLGLFLYVVHTEGFKFDWCVFVRCDKQFFSVCFEKLAQAYVLNLASFPLFSVSKLFGFKRDFGSSVHASSHQLLIPCINDIVLFLDQPNCCERLLEYLSMADLAFPAWTLLLNDF